MNALDWLQPLSEPDGGFTVQLSLTLLHFLWQGCVIAAAVYSIGWLLQRSSATVRYWLHVGALLLMVVCVSATFAIVSVSQSNDVTTSALDFETTPFNLADAGTVVGLEADSLIVRPEPDLPIDAVVRAGLKTEGLGSLSETDQRTDVAVIDRERTNGLASAIAGISPWLTTFYFAGVAMMLFRLTRSLWSGHRLRREATIVDDDAFLAMIERQARRVGLKTAPAVVFCSRITVLTVIGIMKPVILLPASLAMGLAPQQLEALLAHELAHIRRFDLVVNLLQRFVEALLFFHPAVWFVSRLVSIERERACDDTVVAAGWQRVNYADALVRMAELSSAPRNSQFADQATALAATGSKPSDLKRRVFRLLGHDDSPKIRLTQAGLTVFVVVLTLAVFAPLFVHSWAQSAGTRIADGETERAPDLANPDDEDVAGNNDEPKKGQRPDDPRSREFHVQEEQRVPDADQRLIETIDAISIFECRKIIRKFDDAGNTQRACEARERLANRLEGIAQQPVESFTRPIPPDPNLEHQPSDDGRNVVGVQTQLDGIWSTGKGTAASWKDWIIRKQKQYRTDRLRLLSDAGQGYRKTNDLDSAKRVLLAGLKGNEICDEPVKKLIKKYWPVSDAAGAKSLGSDPAAWVIIGFLHDLASVLRDLHDLDGAIAVQTRLVLAHFSAEWDQPSAGPTRRANELWQMIREKREPLPPLFWFNVLDEKNPSITFDLTSTQQKGSILQFHDQNVVAMPTHDFSELRVTAEFHGPGGFLDCYTIPVGGQATSLGVIGFDRPATDTVQTISETIKVPANTGLIQFAVRGKELRVGKVTVEATFQKREARTAEEEVPLNTTQDRTPSGSATTGQIDGQLADQRGEAVSVAGAVAYLCDAKTGYPVLATTKKPLDPDSPQKDWIYHVWYTVTDKHGAFEFKEVPLGHYRIVAQSWLGTEGIPWLNPERRRGPFGETSPNVRIAGVAEEIELASETPVRVTVRKLGNGVLKIVNDPKEANAFLLVSRQRPIGDPILGPEAWGDKFFAKLIAITHMSEPYVTFFGLPDGQDVHAGLFNYDNSPGVGGGSYRVGQKREVSLRIFAGWSNGHYDPPDRLLKLVEHFEEHSLSVSKLIGLELTDAHNYKALRRILAENPSRMVDVEGLGEFPFVDLLAASSYKQLRAHHRARRERRKRITP